MLTWRIFIKKHAKVLSCAVWHINKCRVPHSFFLLLPGANDTEWLWCDQQQNSRVCPASMFRWPLSKAHDPSDQKEHVKSVWSKNALMALFPLILYWFFTICVTLNFLLHNALSLLRVCDGSLYSCSRKQVCTKRGKGSRPAGETKHYQCSIWSRWPTVMQKPERLLFTGLTKANSHIWLRCTHI